MRHFLDIASLTVADISTILNRAQALIDKHQHLQKQLDLLKNMTVANLFFEASTRTRVSFELAATRLGATVINFDIGHASTQKGEAIIDTCNTLHVMGVQFFVVRHSENGFNQHLSERVSPGIQIINAGDGTRAHPSQALLDLLTIQQYKKKFKHLTIAIVGDIAHSRVANSLMVALEKMGVKQIRLIGPEAYLPENLKTKSYHRFIHLQEGVSEVDVIYTLRIQKERMHQSEILNEERYFSNYGITQKILALAKSDAIVMHPGPINRGVEIASDVADGRSAKILRQVENGVAIRMAILDFLNNPVLRN